MQAGKDIQSTKDRILDAAESLFAERGFDGASLRVITAQAGVNLSVVYYYFSSKEDLLRSVVERYFSPVFEREKKLFRDAFAKHGNAPIPLRELLEIFVVPRLTISSENARRLNSMIFSQKEIGQKKIFNTVVGATAEMNSIFERELSRTLPQLELVELRVRMFAINASLHGIQKISPFIGDFFPKSVSNETYLKMLLNCFEGALCAKSTI